MDGELVLTAGPSARKGVRYTDGGEVERWLQRLPLLPSAEAARQVGHALDQVAAQGVRPGPLFRFLERLAPPLGDLLEELERDAFGNTAAPSDVPQPDADLLLQLQWRMALRYRAVIDRRPPLGIAGIGSGRRKLTAAYRVMHYVGGLMESYAQLNRPVRADAWPLFASTYLFGSNAAPNAVRGSFDNEFKYRLMLARLCPHEFKAMEWAGLQRLVRDLAAHCRLARGDTADGPHRLLIDPEGERAPFGRAGDRAWRAGSIHWVLDLEPAAARLGAALSGTGGGTVSIGRHMLPRYACTRLLESCHATNAQQRRAREGANRVVTVVGGLSAIVAEIEDKAGPDRSASTGTGGNCLAPDGPAYWAEAYRKPVAVRTRKARLVDASRSGAGLLMAGGAYRTGELIRVEDAGETYLASVRWVRAEADGWRLGIEKLGTALRPCRLAVGTATGQTREAPALLFETGDGQAVALHNLNAHLHDRVLLHRGEAEGVEIARDRLYAISAVFESFRLLPDEVESLTHEPIKPERAPRPGAGLDLGRTVARPAPGPEDVWASNGYR